MADFNYCWLIIFLLVECCVLIALYYTTQQETDWNERQGQKGKGLTAAGRWCECRPSCPSGSRADSDCAAAGWRRCYWSCCLSFCRCRFNCCRRPNHQRGGAKVGPWGNYLLDPRRIGAQSCVAGRIARLATCARVEGSDPDLCPSSIRLSEIQRPTEVTEVIGVTATVVTLFGYR